jgi:predicted hydrocarbon binding protein
MMINLMEGFDRHLEPEKKILLLEECGRKCIRDTNEELIKNTNELYKNSNDLKDFLEEFNKLYDSLQIIDDEVIIIWEKCFCPIIGKIPPDMISSTFCHCSRGWVKELFEGAMEQPIDVIIEESITKGDSRCRLRILFP